jgi:hypothetical protein
LKFKSNNFILKAHGPINWYNRTNGENGLYLFIPLKRNIRGGSLDTLRAYEYDNNRKQYFTSIVPPGIKRKTYPEIWVRIKDILEKVDEIIVIGFSFNDKHIREEFQGINFNKNLQINLVNPLADKLIDTYRDVFKTNNIFKIHDTLGDYCQWIVEQERTRELGSFLQ